MFTLNSSDFAGLDKHYKNLLFNSLTGFKSSNLIGTVNLDKRTNLAIFSSAFHLGASPPLIGLVSRPNSVKRDTIENIHEMGYYTINHVNQEIIQQAHQCSARYDEVSEYRATGLTEEWKDDFAAPFVKESHIQLGLKYKKTVNVELNNTDIIIGEIEKIIIKNDIVKQDGYVDLEAAGTVCISSLDSYHATNLLDAMAYAKPDQAPSSIRDKRFINKKT